MTTAAMIFGMMPVAIGHGDGGETRAPMGVTVIGGLITSTSVLTLIVVPVIYTLVESLLARAGALWQRLPGVRHADPDDSNGSDGRVTAREPVRARADRPDSRM